MRLALLAVIACASQAQEIGVNCVPCHSEQRAEVLSHKHGAKGVSCEVCHGTSRKHRDALGAASPDRVAAPHQMAALCGSCHPAQRKTFDAGPHGKVVAANGEKRAAHCGTCHGTHAARQPQAMKRQCDRCHAQLPATCRVPCATCHDPHGLARK